MGVETPQGGREGSDGKRGVAGVDGDKSLAVLPARVNVECVFFGPLRDPVGTKRVVREVPDDATVESLLHDLGDAYDGIDFFEDGDLRGDRTITVDGKDVRHREGLDTRLSEGDTVRMTTAVYGGRESPERTLQSGLQQRLV